MRKFGYLSVVGLVFFSLGFSHARYAPSPAPSATPSAIPSALPSPMAPGSSRINVGKITGAQTGEEAMVAKGVELANAMIDKPCFKQWVTAARYTENNGLSSAQIYDMISTMRVQVDVELYYQNNRTVGFEYDPFDGVVHMNRKFVNTASMVADNLLHEDRGHGLGFHHYGKFSTSVPYGMNYAYEGCSQQQMLARNRKGKLIPFKPRGLHIEVRKKKKAA